MTRIYSQSNHFVNFPNIINSWWWAVWKIMQNTFYPFPITYTILTWWFNQNARMHNNPLCGIFHPKTPSTREKQKKPHSKFKNEVKRLLIIIRTPPQTLKHINPKLLYYVLYNPPTKCLIQSSKIAWFKTGNNQN